MQPSSVGRTVLVCETPYGSYLKAWLIWKTWQPGGVVALQFIRGVKDRFQRIMRKNINRTVEPHTTLYQILLHPKDKIRPENKCNTRKEIPCQYAIKCTLGRHGVLLQGKKNKKKECEKETATRQTRSIKEKAWTPQVSHHQSLQNGKIHYGLGEGQRHPHQRWIMDAIEIRMQGLWTNNRDEGALMLLYIKKTLTNLPDI